MLLKSWKKLEKAGGLLCQNIRITDAEDAEKTGRREDSLIPVLERVATEQGVEGAGSC